MEPSYLYESEAFKVATHFRPQVFDSRGRNLSLFTVPHDNSVGTNDIGKAFPKGEINYKVHFKNAVDDIGGGGVYMPVITPDVIGFGQVRTFLLFNFKRKIYREFRIMMSIEKYIEKIAIADADRLHFVFEIEKQNPKSNDPWDVSYSLQFIDLSGEKARVIKEIDTGRTTIWERRRTEYSYITSRRS